MKLLVVGGKFGKTYLEAVKSSKNWEIAGIVAKTDETLKEVGKKYQIPEHVRFKDINLALEKSGCEAVAVAVPNWLHYEFAKKVIEANKHLILEKPLTDTWEQAIELVRLLNSKTDLEGMAGQTLRGEVVNRMIEYVLKQEVIGNIESLTFESHWYWIDDPNKSWRFTLPDMYLDDIGIHQFDLIRMMLGNKRCKSVMAIAQKAKSYPLEIRTTCSSSMMFDDEIMVNYFGSMGTKGNPVGWQGNLAIYGEKGAIIKPEKAAPYVDFYEKKEKILVEDIIGDDIESAIPLIDFTGIAYLLEDFYYAIKEHKDPITDLQDNLFSHQILLAHKRSADLGKNIILNQEFPFD